ncbi:hypothetical protein [Streptomyces sp. Rer75]|uniref:hypothetical protein n=1 Tax=unclassified Streptomyces TaxID=2593676 RepID=UPI0015CFFC9C|nr:hypothetical protein [Streptomyces sp. Rer75]QLH25368.1 hypothetical protein HYQ63_36050 [Streptomyces sp. Rer75]
MCLEVKRSIAVALFVVLLGLSAAVWLGADQSSASWSALLYSLRLPTLVAAPVTLAAGIWHGGRERRADVTELMATTPRPRLGRLAPAFLVIAGVAGLAQATLSVGAATTIAPYTTYDDGTWLLGLTVALLAILAVALLGFGIGRMAPTPVAAPLGAVVLFLLLAKGEPGDARPRPLLDIVKPSPPWTDDFHRVLTSVSVAQLIWFAALAVTGILLAVAATARARAWAMIPAVAGLVAGALAAPSAAVVPDPGATAMVCAPEDDRVCVTTVHARTLRDFTGPARQLLAAFAKVPDGPKRVHEDTTTWMFEDDSTPPADRADLDTVRVELNYQTREGGLAWTPSQLLGSAARLATVNIGCYPEDKEWNRALDASQAMTALLVKDPLPRQLTPSARTAYDTLRVLPDKKRYERIGDARKAGLTCGDPMGVLKEQETGR